MDLTLSPEQLEPRDVLRTFLARRSTEADVRRLMATDAGFDPRCGSVLGGVQPLRP